MLAGYARVSTTDQNTDAQIPALKKAGCTRIYQEQGSGRNMERPELLKCLDRLEKGDTLVIWRLDRLGRSIRDLLDIMDQLHKAGVHFRSLTENFDTTTAAGRLVFHVFAALAQFERELIRERTKLGLTAARARGRSGGRKSTLSPQQKRQVRVLWASRTVTRRQIAEQYGVSTSTIDRTVNQQAARRKP